MCRTFFSYSKDEVDNTFVFCNHRQDQFKCRLEKGDKVNRKEMNVISRMHLYCDEHLLSNGWIFRLICFNFWCKSNVLFNGKRVHTSLQQLDECERKMNGTEKSTRLQDHRKLLFEIETGIRQHMQSSSLSLKMLPKVLNELSNFFLNKHDEIEDEIQLNNLQIQPPKDAIEKTPKMQNVVKKRLCSESSVEDLVHEIESKNKKTKKDMEKTNQSIDIEQLTISDSKDSFISLNHYDNQSDDDNCRDGHKNRKRISDELDKQSHDQKQNMLEKVRNGYACIKCPNGDLLTFKTKDDLVNHVRTKMTKSIDKVSFCQSINFICFNLWPFEI